MVERKRLFVHFAVVFVLLYLSLCAYFLVGPRYSSGLRRDSKELGDPYNADKRFMTQWSQLQNYTETELVRLANEYREVKCFQTDRSYNAGNRLGWIDWHFNDYIKRLSRGFHLTLEMALKRFASYRLPPSTNSTAFWGKLYAVNEQTIKLMTELNLRERNFEQMVAGNKQYRANPIIDIPEDQLDKGPRPESILILSATDYADTSDPRWEITLQGLENRNEYAQHYGYRHEFLNLSRYDAAKPYVEHPCWLKIPALQEAFARNSDVEWIWWLDMDAMIVNGNLDLVKHVLHPHVMEQRLMYNRLVSDISDAYEPGSITPAQGQVDPNELLFLFGHDSLTINAGSFFIKRSELTDAVLQMWGDQLFIVNAAGQRRFRRREQDAFIKLVLEHETVARHTGLFPQAMFNSFSLADPQQFYWGDFVLHFAGASKYDSFVNGWHHVWERRIRPGHSDNNGIGDNSPPQEDSSSGDEGNQGDQGKRDDESD